MNRDPHRPRHASVLTVVLAVSAFAAPSSQMLPGFAASLPVSSKTLAAYRTCVLTGTPSTSTAVADSWANQASGNQNNGSGTTMDSRSSSGANRRPYVTFDLTKCHPVIAATSTVKLATLRLYVTFVPAVCRTEDIFKVTAAWTEGAITWNNQPFGTTINNPPTASRTDAITIGAASCQNTAAGTYVSGWTVTADVQSFVTGASTNNGWMIRDDAEGSAFPLTARFRTKNANILAQAPQLVVTYVT
jgi:hypothetical protein